MASIEKRNGKFRVRWRDPDGKDRSRQAPTKAAAQRLRREVEACVAEGRRWEPAHARERAGLQEGLEAYVRHCHRTYASSTVRLYASRLDVFRRFLVERHGSRRILHLELLTRGLIEGFYDWLLETGRHGHPRSKSSAKKYIQTVEGFWAWAYDHDDYGIEVGPPKKLKLPQTPRTPTQAPTWGEMDRMIGASKGWQRELYLVLRFTGLRVQQAMGLRWEHVDLQQGTLTVPGHLGKTPSERHGRTVPISRHLVDELAGWGRREGWLIRCDRKTRTARSRDASAAWRRAEVPSAKWKKRPHHAFRKGFVTGLRSLGADPDAGEYLVGHTLGGQRDTYTDPIGLHLCRAVDLIPPIGGQGDVIRVPFRPSTRRRRVPGVSRRTATPERTQRLQGVADEWRKCRGIEPP